MINKKNLSVGWAQWHKPTESATKLRQENQLSPGVQGQPEHHRKLSQKIKIKKEKRKL